MIRLGQRQAAGSASTLGMALVLVLAGTDTRRVEAADTASPSPEVTSLADNRFTWPSRERLVRVLTLRDYNTRIVLVGTALLGAVAGVVGTFMLLRKRSLVGDVVSHASLPGIAAAFLWMEALSPGGGRWLPGLLLGALLAGFAGMACVVAISRLTRIKEDAALAIVLSVFFGFGIVLFTVVQAIPSGTVAGLQGFIFGKAAALVAADVQLIAWTSLVALTVCAAFFKEFSLLCFDDGYAAASGWPVVALDLLLMALVSTVTVIGLQSVGLLMVVALLIVPAVSARFWTDHLPALVIGAGTLGCLTAVAGTLSSALFSRLPTGAIIVLCGCAAFLLSMFASPRHGLVRRWIVQHKLQASIDRQHLLRACFEYLEDHAAESVDGATARVVPLQALATARAWPPRTLRRLINAAERDELLYQTDAASCQLTEAGWHRAKQVARNHRLWELYLISRADVAPQRVDRYADMIEHVLEPEIVLQLEAQLAAQSADRVVVPPSPHGPLARGEEA
ncbi:MAG: metal ABC transporter permease [Pirellulales bacterium]|nr:metal ABC transporter permease [Pirellulales bacterium]